MGSRLQYDQQPLPGVTVREATLEDCLSVGDRLREEDLAEIRAYAGLGGVEGLLHCFIHSEVTLVVVINGSPETLFGVGPSKSDAKVGIIWLLSTPKLFDISKPFIRHCRSYLDALSEPYELVMNYVDARNESHIRWLRWCGFRFIHLHEQFGHEKRPFYEVVRV